MRKYQKMARRFFGFYKNKVGMHQRDAVKAYLEMGKSVDEIQELLKCPRASIRGRISELKNRQSLLN